MGKQHVGAAVNLIAYYLFALPLGIWYVPVHLPLDLTEWLDDRLAFNGGWGLAGLWVGQCVALFLVGIGEYILVACTDWEKEVEIATSRIEEDEPQH
jgi:MATE family multidrug resistance protein